MIAAIILLLVFFGSLSTPDDSTDTSADSDTTAATTPTAPADESESTEQPTPSEEPEPPSPSEDLDEQIRAALGDVNRDDVERVQEFDYSDDMRVLDVKFALNDNLTEGMIKTGAKIDITDVLEAVQESGVPVRFLNIEATFAMVDNLGNESEDTVVRASYRGNIIKQINFENFLYENVYEIADDVDIHPAFEE